MRRPATAPLLLTAFAAALRFSTLGVQSFGHDEAATVERVRLSFAAMLRILPEGENSPPLYYVLAWGWTKLFGAGEVGIRSLSALFGTATVAVVYLVAARVASRRAALLATALVAANPWLVWYSQEARTYALLALLCTTSFLLFLRTLEAATARNIAGWALVSALAIGSHYFAVFIVIPEAVWLIVAASRSGADGGALRRTWVAVAALGAVGVVLLPLAAHQAGTGGPSWIAAIPIAQRIRELPELFLSAQTGLGVTALPSLGAVLIGAALLALGTEVAERRGARAPAAIGALALVLPLVLAPTRFDYFYAPNVIAALPLLAIVLAVGFAARRAGFLGVGVGLGLCLLSVAFAVQIAIEPSLQRRDWRSAAHLIGPAPVDRAIVVPDHGDHPLLVYLPNTRRLPANGALVRELDAASVRNHGGDRPPSDPALLRELARFGPRMTSAGDRRSVVRARSPRPRRLLRSTFDGVRIDGRAVEVLVQSP